MGTVITAPRDTKLQIRYVTGTNPETGAPIIKTKTYTKIKDTASDQSIYDVAMALQDLQKYTVDEIRILKEWLAME